MCTCRAAKLWKEQAATQWLDSCHISFSSPNIAMENPTGFLPSLSHSNCLRWIRERVWERPSQSCEKLRASLSLHRDEYHRILCDHTKTKMTPSYILFWNAYTTQWGQQRTYQGLQTAPLQELQIWKTITWREDPDFPPVMRKEMEENKALNWFMPPPPKKLILGHFIHCAWCICMVLLSDFPKPYSTTGNPGDLCDKP